MKLFLIQREVDREAEDSLGSSSTQKEASTSTKVKVGSIGHAVVNNSEWEEVFLWLMPVTNDLGIMTGMLCRICKRHKTENKYNKSRVWSGTLCTCIRKDSVRRQRGLKES